MNTLTRDYMRWLDTAGPAAASHTRASLQALFGAGHLSRPMFLEAAQVAGLTATLVPIAALLAGLPDRLDGGDAGAFADRLGVTGRAREVVERTWGGPDLAVTRADLFHTTDGFRLLEFNTLAIGGTDIGELAKAMMRMPTVAGFARERGLRFTDPFPLACAQLVAAARSYGLGTRPRIALVYGDDAPPRAVRTFTLIAILLHDRGLPAVACNLSSVESVGGRLRALGEPVELVYRFFLLHDAVSDTGWNRVLPILRAHEQGSALVVAPFRADLTGSKRALAMLWDEGISALLTAAERELVRTVTPWAQVLAPEIVAPDGTRVDTVRFCVEHRSELVCKPAMDHGGHGVVLGAYVDAARWMDVIRIGIRRHDVVQRRVYSSPPEEFVEGEPPRRVARTVNWGAFVIGGQYGGVVARATPEGHDLVAYGKEAQIGCCYEQPVQ